MARGIGCLVVELMCLGLKILFWERVTMGCVLMGSFGGCGC